MNRSNNKNLFLITIVFLILVIFMFIKYYSGINITYFDRVSSIDKLIFNIGYENIYYYIYLGFFNITTFISIFIPFIDIKYILIGFNIINVYVSILLFYKLLKLYKFNDKICLYSSLLFMILSPYLINIFNEVIYTNYLPFFILGIISIKEENKRNLVFSIIMIGFTNYKCLLLSFIIFSLYCLYEHKKETIKLIIVVLLSLSFIYLPIIFYNYSGYIFNNNISVSIIIYIGIISMLLNKENIIFNILLLLSLLINRVFNYNISMLFVIYILSICMLLKNIDNNKISSFNIYKLFIFLILLSLFINSNYISYFFILIIFILMVNKNNITILLLLIYFILYSNVFYSNKYINDFNAFNYIKYNTFNYNSFTSKSFPYKNELLNDYIILKDSDVYEYNSKLKKYYINNLNIIYISSDIKHINNEYIGSGKIIIDVSSINDKILFIRSFDNIKINNDDLINNEISFINNNKHLEITIKDKFNINNFECYYKDNNNEIVDINNINISKDGYIILKYKYDKFFNIKIDNKKIKYYKVNNDLVGFKVSSGKHKISISYFSYYKLVSFIITIISIIIYKYFFRKKY